MAAFEELGLPPELIAAIEDIGWQLPTPVQAEAIPLILGGGDVMAAAETGSGKTGAFALPVLQIVHETLRRRERAASSAGPSNGSNAGDSSSTQGGGGGRRPSAGQAGPLQMSLQDRDAVLAVSPDGTACQSRSEKSWGGGRATAGAYAGKVYYEVKVTDEGLARVGWSTRAGSLDLGTDKQGFGFGGTGKKSHNRQFDPYGEPYGLNDVVGCLLDCDAGQLSFSRNGRNLGVAFTLPPYLKGQVLYPAICLKNAEVALNFGSPGSPAWAHPPPAGYVGIGAAGPDCVASAAAGGFTPRGGGGGVKGASTGGPLAILLAPSRDLAEQTAAEITKFSKHLSSPSLRCALLVGGTDPGPQIKALREGVDVVVGTPGRMVDFMESGKLVLDQVRFFVLDEADRLIDHLDEVMSLFKRIPKAGVGIDRLQVLLFSATLHSAEVKSLSQTICQNPILVDLKGRESVPETVDHVVVMVDPREDRTWLQSKPEVYTDNAHACDPPLSAATSSKEAMSEAVKRLKPRLLQRIVDKYAMDQALIFCRTNFDCDNLEKFFMTLSGGGGGGFRGKKESGKEGAYSCLVLGGARSMDERRRALQAFKEGDVRFLICTDVAARGIDIKELPYVINLTLPDKSEDYIHRVGRVGRADALGLAISLVSAVPEKVWYCTLKGYKPWLEPDKKNTRTHEQGGHTIWYDEPDLLKQVEARLKRPVPPLQPDLSLPPEIASRLAGSGDAYGQQRGGGTSKEVVEHLASIQGSVQTLGQLEWEAQSSFLALKSRWAASHVPPAPGVVGGAQGKSL